MDEQADIVEQFNATLRKHPIGGYGLLIFLGAVALATLANQVIGIWKALKGDLYFGGRENETNRELNSMPTANEYQDAIRELGMARAKVRVIANTVRQLCDALNQWEKADPIAINGTLENKLKDWPASSIISTVLDQWKKAAAEVQRIWDHLGEDTQGLRSPQEIKW